MATRKTASNSVEKNDLYQQETMKDLKLKNSLSPGVFKSCNVVLTPKQMSLYKGIRNNILTAVHGPAGTSKTYTACYTALALLADKKVERVIITKPIQESEEKLGALPGDVEEKIAPYKRSFYNTFVKIIGKETTDKLFNSGDIIFEPLAYMRGSTYDNSVMILDECQNATIKQLMLWVTRLGNDSKAIMMGDTSQYDVRKRDSGYVDFIKITEGMEYMFLLEFNNEDIVRNKFLIQLTNRYDKYRAEKDI